MMLKDYVKILYEVKKDKKPFYTIGASVMDGEFTIHRIDFEEWEYNRRTGRVEGADCLDETNTEKLCDYFQVNTSAKLVQAVKRAFGKDGSGDFLTNFRKFCDEQHITYKHEAWY